MTGAEMVILFDLDATLLDHETAVRGGLAGLRAAFGAAIPWDQDQFFVRWEAVAEKYLPFSLTGKLLSFQDQRRMRIKEVFGSDLSTEEADRRFQIYLDGYNTHWTLYPDARPCLQALQDHRLGMITNGDGPQQRAKLATLGITDLFPSVIISREVGFAKPDQEIFELAANAAGAAPDRCMYVGDRLDTDAQAAAKVGMHGVWLNRVDGAEGPGVTTIHGLVELPPLVLAMERKNP
jgi:putative hydrolase of the HAD superfamily